ncbi:HEAT repeat domain-containing protein [Azospirillum sp. SYSU D00513]|uniref:HEAT repeat domain-containing protein n=1 Tax=Azospirillum sp. SYSU D00513 TaxID=2812561 RepID=UPI001A95BF10|nr:HEAT repeat domain-containing protein [Azospirillum sp. SYSU D00513]
MPLVKAPAPQTPAAPAFPDRASVLAAIESLDPSERRAAAWASRAYADGIDIIAHRLAVESDAAVVEAMILNLVAIGSPKAAAVLAPLLRSGSAARRFAAAEALRDLGPDALPMFDALIRDEDPQVRIMAAEVARGQLGGAAAQTLERLLPDEDHVNTACAFIDVLAEIGSAGTAPVLRHFADRHAGNAYVRFAVDTALARLPAA